MSYERRDVAEALRRLQVQLEDFAASLDAEAISDGEVDAHARQAALFVDSAANSLELARAAHHRLRVAVHAGTRR
jgi:hypothetical protein